MSIGKWKGFLLVTVLVLALSVGPVLTASAAEYKVGFCVMNLYMTWMNYSSEALMDAADEFPEVEVEMQNAEGKVSKQFSIIENFIAQGYDAIITDPITMETLAPVFERAAEKNIPVVTFDRRAKDAPYLFHVGANDVFGGRLAAEYIAAKLDGKGKIVYIYGQVGSSPAIARDEGFKEQLQHYPNLEIVYEQPGGFVREKGMSVMEDAITSTGGDFGAVFSQNDDMLQGALTAMKNSPKVDVREIVTVGYDGIPDGLRSIREGVQDVTIQYPVKMASTAMTWLCEYLVNGTKPEQKNTEINPWIIGQSNLKTADFYPEIE